MPANRGGPYREPPTTLSLDAIGELLRRLRRRRSLRARTAQRPSWQGDRAAARRTARDSSASDVLEILLQRRRARALWISPPVIPAKAGIH